jgi:carbon storage regulator CsrA
MLILTRKVGGKIEVIAPGGQKLTVIVTEIDRNRVRIGIEAPQEFAIYRSELNESEREQVNGHAD